MTTLEVKVWGLDGLDQCQNTSVERLALVSSLKHQDTTVSLSETVLQTWVLLTYMFTSSCIHTTDPVKLSRTIPMSKYPPYQHHH